MALVVTAASAYASLPIIVMDIPAVEPKAGLHPIVVPAVDVLNLGEGIFVV